MANILDTSYAVLTYLEEEGFLQLKWKKHPNSRVYRQTFQKALETIQEKSIPMFLSDLSQAGLIPPEDRNWLESEIIPAAIQAGLRKIATVMDRNIFKQYYVSRLIDSIEEKGGFVKMFDDYQEAVSWLKAKE